MGLAERRAVDEYKKGPFVAYEKTIKAIIQDKASLTVEWDSLAAPEYGHLYAECFGPVYFDPLIAALESIARDDMGKEALAASLKAIVIKNSDEFHNSYGFSFASGTLTINHKPCTNVDAVAERTKAITELLEKNL